MLKTPKLKNLSFLIYGIGLSGTSVVKFFKKKKIKNFKVWDDNNKNLFKKHRTKNLKHSLNSVDYIVLSPGISLIKNKKLSKFKNKIITDIDLFFLENNNSKSIVITGTNGKSTTCKLLQHLFIKNNFKCFLGGNIGVPILDVKNTKNSYVIIEASSFQLSHSKFIRPDFAFFLNLSNDHLDWHGNINNYLNSKLKIFSQQTKNQYAILNRKLRKKFYKKSFLSKLILPDIIKYKKIKHKIKNYYLSSEINDENMSFVLTFSRLIKISDKSFINSMKSFKGLPHRFEIFLKKKDVTFINDSKATTFKAAESAISSLENIYWILGGIPKKKDRINLSKYKRKIIKCYLIGKNTNFFKKQVKDELDFSITKNLKNSILNILKDCKSQRVTGKTILLSPAASSFDQFNNFENRGEEFKKLCNLYARKFI